MTYKEKINFIFKFLTKLNKKPFILNCIKKISFECNYYYNGFIFYENARHINGYLFFLCFITFIKKLDHFEGNNYYRVKIDVYLKKIRAYIYTLALN